ncbi:MAB21L1 [Cordylochernes scorpioides]|uniref:MAB21L1 n=1 Tax=Cordylochernes scorpioides TaxID=51811 RepID=A0ABY6K1D4_9ARAC|nr:MAB21L1 [Cordylochernes scorpioides]
MLMFEAPSHIFTVLPATRGARLTGAAAAESARGGALGGGARLEAWPSTGPSLVPGRSPEMLVPPDMMAAQSKLLYQLNKFYGERVAARRAVVAKTVREVCKVVQDVLKEVEVQEPRFISSLNEGNGRYEGFEVISPTEFEAVLYLNQMGVFNFVDDGTLPGCAVLKLSDGRKRSMSLWVEFITASGYLSARKIRSRFQTLVAQACDKCAYRDIVKLVADTSEVRLRIRERFVVQITPAFRCTGLWPRSAAQWPVPHIPWPGPALAAEVKAEGFDLLSKECPSLQGKQSAMEGDAWVLHFGEAEARLLQGGCRRKCLSLLRTLRDRHLELPGSPVAAYHLKTLLLYECEKHPRESEWDESCLGDRINGILLQLISCLQCRRCPHYFLPQLDLFKGKSASALENAAKQAWRLTRELLTNVRALENLFGEQAVVQVKTCNSEDWLTVLPATRGARLTGAAAAEGARGGALGGGARLEAWPSTGPSLVPGRSPEMLVPPDMMAAQSKLLYQLNKFYGERVAARRAVVAKTVREVCKVVQDVLKEVEVQEPRFISSLNEGNGRYEGFEVISPTEFEAVLYLNQMGVFNFVDDGTLPGCAVLKLSDGRKRSMSLWVEFITASGYLSARKIRSRFQTLVAQACDKCAYRDIVKLVADTSEVRLRIRERFVVQITPAFRCTGLWPRSAAQWPVPHIPWPGPALAAEVKAEGFDLLSKECPSLQGKQSAMEGDAWVLHFGEAEARLLQGGCRRKCLSLLRTLRDRHLELPGSPVAAYHLKTLLLYECEKHPRESEWDESCLGDRINGILLQLISCLQCRRCPHYFLPQLDLFKGKSASALENAAKQAWRLTRELLTNVRALENLRPIYSCRDCITV